MKKLFENAVWWSGVVMVGIILGITLQFVRAWTEPSEAPPGGNLGAPVNTGPVAQLKNGVLGVLGLMVYNDFNQNGIDVTGKVLTAQDAYGAAAWAGGGAVFTKCQIKDTQDDNVKSYPTCPGGWTDIHHYASARIFYAYYGSGGGYYWAFGPYTENTNDDSWWSKDWVGGSGVDYRSATEACTVCERI